MLAGFLAGRFKLLLANSSEILSRFVFIVSLPALIFVSLARVPVSEFFNWPFLGALGGGMLITFCLALIIARFAFPDSLTAHGLHALTAMFSSTGYVGLPVLLLIYGDAALVPGLIGAVITGAFFLPLSIILAEVDRNKKAGHLFSAPFKAVLRNPLLIATAAGLIFSALNLELPLASVTFFTLLGDAYIPCALFAAGLFISGCSIKGEVKEISWLVFVKLLIHPLITWWLAYQVFDLKGILPAIAVIQAALPSGVPVFVLAQQYNCFVTRSSSVIVISTAISLFSLSALLIYLA